MKLILGLIVAVLAVLAFAERPTFSLQPMGFSTSTSLNNLNIGVTVNKDLLIYLDVSASSAPAMVIRRRNAEGVYVPVANYTEAINFYASTNGKWIAVLPPSSSSATAHLFSIDANNVLSNSTTLNTVGGFMLSDDTFVAYDPVSELNDGNFTIRTYQHDASNNTWNNIPGTEIVVTSTALFNGDYASYRADDNFLVFADMLTSDNITVQIHKRNADKSWSIIDSVMVNSSFGQPPNVLYNGADTLFCAYPMFVSQVNSIQTYGIMFLYTKVNGVWTETKLQLTDLGVKPAGLLGYSAFFVDANTLLVSAGLDGFAIGGGSGGLQGGKILMFTRNESNIWQPSVDLVVGTGLFALGMGVSDRDVIAVSITSASMSLGVTFYSAPLCFTQPINVTCNDQQVSDCSLVDFSSLYTVNNPQCGAVTASTNGFSLINNQAVQTQFSFTKGFGPTAYCNATVTCPAPPVAATVPVSNVQGTPTSTRVSSAAIVQLGLASIALIVALL